ncbi:MAG TPA: FecR domain-containing protein [Polyangiaceae bacterium]|nr:FecR domain-containing protein [Polyangiaceae bacterium]
MVLAAVGIGLWQVFQTVFAGHQYETQIGEQRIVQLSDGSVVTLNAVSSMEVRMSSSRRDIVLRGEAIFKVAHDKTRPFLVHTGHATVRAVGTQFNVYARPDGSTTVAVLEGRVEVAATENELREREPLSNIEPVTVSTRMALAAGEIAQIGRTGAVQRQEKANVSNAVAWRQRRLVFDRTPLEDIVSEFNRYNRNIRLRLVNVPEGTHHYSGGFDADDPRSLALYLSKEPDLVVDQQGAEIIIQGRAPQQ